MPESEEGTCFNVSVQFREGIEKISAEEIRLIESNLPELLKLVMEELPNVED